MLVSWHDYRVNIEKVKGYSEGMEEVEEYKFLGVRIVANESFDDARRNNF